MAWNLPIRGDRSSRSVYVNYPAIGIFAVLAAALAGGVHTLHKWQVARHTPLVLAEAKKRVAAGEDAAALAYYQTYLGYRPDDVEAITERALLKAKLAKNTNSATDAFFTLLQAMPKVPDRVDVRHELVALAVKLGRMRDCEEELDTLLDQMPDDLDVLKLAARGAVQLRKFDVARGRYEELLERGVDEPEIYQELLRLLSVEINDPAAADAVLAQLLKRHPASSAIRVMAGAYYFRRGQLAQADEQISIAINDLQATDPTLYRLQAEIARQRRLPLELEARLTKLANKTEIDLPTEFQLAEIDLALGRRHPAQKRLLRIARDERATAEQVWRVIILMTDADLLEDEAALRLRLKQLDVAERFTPSLAMWDRMREKDWKAALELARGLLKQTKVSPQFTITLSMWRAECYAQLGDIAEQINCYRRALDANADYQPARSRLAQLLFRIGRFKEAQGEYATLIQQSPIFAREFVTELLQAQSPETQSQMSAVEVDRMFVRWRESAPSDPMPVLCELDFLQRKGAAEKVARLTAEGLKTWPKEIGFRVAELDELLRKQNWDAAWAALDDAEQQCGSQPALLIRRILCLEGLDPQDRSAQLIACTEQFSKFDRDGQAQVWPVLIRGLQRAGVDPQSVEDILNEYGDKNPGDGLARLVRLQNAVSAGDMTTARQHLEALRTALGEESPSFQVASILCDTKAASLGDAAALLRARAGLESLRKSSPQFLPQFLTLTADLDLLQKRPQDALAHLREAVDAGDSRVSTLTRTIALMAISGQLDQTVPYLKSLERPAASDETATEDDPPKTVAGLLPVRRDLPALRTVLAAAAPDSWPLALATFRVDLELKQPDRAAEMIQLAVKSAPQAPLVWANWFAYLERYRPDQLNQALSDVEDKLSLVERARLLPAILLRHDRREDAVTLLKVASAEVPNDPVIFRTRVRLLRETPGEENIESLLHEAIASQDQESAAVREVARRELARLKSVSKDYRIFREAAALAAEIVAQASPEDVEARLLQGEVNSAHFAHWKDALAAYRKLAESPRLEVRAEALLQEARIHEQHLHWDEQAAVLNSLNELTPKQPQVLVQLLFNAVRRNDAAAANQIDHDLTPLVKDDQQLLLCDVLLSSLSDDHADLVPRILTAYKEGRIKETTALEWLELLKADQESEMLLRQQLESQQPETLSKYILFLTSRHRAAEAVPHLSTLWKSGARDAAAAVASTMSASPFVTPKDLEGIRAALLKLAERNDTSVSLLAAAAVLEDHAGRHAEAMDLYRRIHAQAPDNVVALNNLSFLEALSDTAPGDDALERIRHAIELYGPNDQLLDTEGVVLLRRGDAQAARERFQRAWEQRPEATYQAHLAWALTELRQFDAAAAAFQKADFAATPARFHPLEKPLDDAWRQQLLDQQPADATVVK